MPVETTINTIADLNPAWPDGSEPKNQGDDHVRKVKDAVKKTWPNIAAPVTATAAELNLLSGKTDVATQADIDAAVLSASIPGVDDPANAGKFLQAPGAWAGVQIDGRGSPIINLGDSGTTAQVLTYSENAEGWRLKATGNFTLTATGFPAGRLAGGLLRLENGGAFPPTTTGITWIKNDNSKTAIFAEAGYTLQATGFNLFAIFSFGDGTVLGKLVG